MPEAANGTGGRDHTRPPGTTTGVARGYVRIEVNPVTWHVVFTMPSVVIQDRLARMTHDGFGGVTYDCDSGISWTVPDTFRSGDTIPLAHLRPGRERIEVTTFGDVRRRYIDGGLEYEAEIRRNDDMYRERAERRNDDMYRERAERERREAREMAARRAAADERAEEMLRMILRPDELARYEKTSQIIVTGSDGQRYLIGAGLVGNVFLLRPGLDLRRRVDQHLSNNALASLCCHPNLYPNGSNEPVPLRDAHVAQILYLRHDLDRFYATANISWYDTAARNEYLDRGRRIGEMRHDRRYVDPYGVVGQR